MITAKNIGTIVASAVLAAGLTAASPASSNHTTCEPVARQFIKYVKKTNNVPPGYYSYGKWGEIAPDDYNDCVVTNFEKSPVATEYEIKVIERYPEWENGTVYRAIKKEN